MYVALETIGLCLFLFLICFLGTGSDTKNLKSLSSYPKDLQNKVIEKIGAENLAHRPNVIVTFVSNFIVFFCLLFVGGLAYKTTNYWSNFINLIIIGEVANLFDLLIIDLLWWRNVKRIRFSFFPDKKDYQNPKEHIYAFIRGAIMFLAVAALNAYILTLF